MKLEFKAGTLSGLAVLLLLGVVGFLLREGIFPPYPDFVFSRESGDVASLYYYWRSFGFSSLRAGTVPLWNPNVFCGVPFAAYPEAALFYPLNLVFLLLPLPAALNASFAGHLALLALFTYLWLRFTGSGRLSSLMGGLALTCSGPAILHLAAGHLSNVCTFAWVPLLFLLAEKFFRTRRPRWAAGAGLVIALQILAGHWQYAYYTAGGLILYLAGRALTGGGTGRRRWVLPGGAVLAGLIALGLAAVQLLPARELAGGSFREELGRQWAAAFSLPPVNLATLVFPGWLGDSLTSLYRGENYFWEMCGYLGLIPLILAGGAVLLRRDRFTLLIALLAAGCVLVALGDSTPLFRLLHAVLPGFRYFRGHAKALFLAAFFLATLAARGADVLFGRLGDGGGRPLRFSPAVRRRLAGGGAVFLLAAGGAALVLALLLPARPPDRWRGRVEADLLAGRHYEIVPPGQPGWWEKIFRETPPDSDYPGYVRRLAEETPFPENSWRTIRIGLLRLGVAAAGLGVLLAGVLRLGRRRKWWAAAAGFLAAGEVALWARPYVTGFDSRTCLWDGEIAGFLSGREEPFRYLPFDPADFNRGMLGGYESILGYQADVPRRYLEYLNRSQGLPAGEPELVPVITVYSPLLDLLNTRFLVLPPGGPAGPGRFPPVLSGAGGGIRENPGALPRALVSGRGEALSGGEILERLGRPGYRPGEVVYLEEDPPERFRTGGGSNPGEARVIAREPGRVGVRAELVRPGILLLNDSFDPGWKAYLGAEEIPIFRANYLMRAVCLDPGSHLVEFRYRPLSFRLGAAVSLATLAALGIAAGIGAARARRARKTGSA